MTDYFHILNYKSEMINKQIDLLYDIRSGILPQKDVLTIEEVSKYTGISVSTLYHESSRRLITCSKKGKKLFFPLIQFIDWYLESYLQNPVRRKKMDLARRSIICKLQNDHR